jgi:hypothetical protein
VHFFIISSLSFRAENNLDQSLGNIISEKGVQVHQENIRAILYSPTPKNLTELKGLFGLCSYYRRFVKGFSQLGAPLTDLTRKGDFLLDRGVIAYIS